MVFKNGAFYQLATPEGRAVYQSGAWSYEYFHTDHLGNTRVSYKANGTALSKTSETSFDPWGVVLRDGGLVNTFQNRFEFLNREKESTFNLNAIRLGARMYNPTIGRFDRVDPLIEEGQQRFTGYHYSFNNPVRFSDPDGLMGEDCCQPIIDFFAGATLTFIDNNSPVPTSLDGGGYRGSAYETGRKVGNALSIVSGVMQVVGGTLGAAAAGGAEVVTAGAASPVALPVGAAAVATTVNGIATITKAASNLNAQGKKNQGGGSDKTTTSNNKNSGKSGKHGDAGRTMSKAEKQIENLQEQAKNAPNKKEREKIAQKIKNIKEDAARKKSGEEHSRSHKK